MNDVELVNMIKAWKPPPPCDRVGCGALHPPGTYHGPAALVRDGEELKTIVLLREDDDGWRGYAQIIEVFTGSWHGDASLRFPDDSTAKVIVGELRLEKGCYAEFGLTGVGAPPAILWAATGETP